ncbi:type II secretion system minor pseudopilin GspH [Metapseudomonas otitidis]|uniref:type II secretion system minor pseudopilin GspH n=1 Tax=Metapseudomonas otitidis TaxID=319939 RepID=UPI0020984C28|nr:type II secretion system minor pseudopilin GspH [Pseudomonas otitidis]MCO7555883.1 type II secretion system minor pseudopilin GspH [Pseudomonas otitidis]
MGARGARGFTLIELLVVLVIIGCLVGLAVFSTGIAGPSRELNNEAERLAGLIGVLVDEAVLDNREYGLRLENDRYQVLRFDEAKARWEPVGKQPHVLPAWAEMKLELEGDALVLPGSVTDGDEKKGSPNARAPQLLILSSGELSPFRLEMGERSKDGIRLQLSSDGFRLPRIEPIVRGRAG